MGQLINVKYLIPQICPCGQNTGTPQNGHLISNVTSECSNLVRNKYVDCCFRRKDYSSFHMEEMKEFKKADVALPVKVPKDRVVDGNGKADQEIEKDMVPSQC